MEPVIMLGPVLLGYVCVALILLNSRRNARKVAVQMREFADSNRHGYSRPWLGDDGNRWCMHLTTGAIVAAKETT